MKQTIYFCALALAAMAARGEGLNEQNVSPEAKWLVHVDCDNLRQTQLGSYLFNKLLAPKAAELANNMPEDLKLNLTNLLTHISSLTAYGADFQMGPEATSVLLINSDADTQKALEGVLVAQILADTNGPVKKLAETTPAVYSVANQVYISPKKDGPIIVSKSPTQLELTRELLESRTTRTAAKNFGGFPTISNSFFLVGVADANNLPVQIPARAKVLQMADGGRVAVGERADQVCLDLSLRGKTAEVTQQIQQVVEGMVALVSLGQPENPDLMSLAKSTKVSSADHLITISMQYPASKVIDRLNDEMSPKPKPDKAPRQKKAKVKKVKPVPAAQPAEEAQPKSESSDQPAAPEKPAAPAEPKAAAEAQPAK
ncbi:MAG: hypothetical protein U1G07_04675 [Verrucomicrobiota bacterium]